MLFSTQCPSDEEVRRVVETIVLDFDGSATVRGLLSDLMEFPFEKYVTTMGRLFIALNHAIDAITGPVRRSDLVATLMSRGVDQQIVHEFDRFETEFAQFSFANTRPLLGGVLDRRVSLFVFIIDAVYHRIAETGARRYRHKSFIYNFCSIIAMVTRFLRCLSSLSLSLSLFPSPPPSSHTHTHKQQTQLFVGWIRRLVYIAEGILHSFSHDELQDEVNRATYTYADLRMYPEHLSKCLRTCKMDVALAQAHFMRQIHHRVYTVEQHIRLRFTDLINFCPFYRLLVHGTNLNPLILKWLIANPRDSLVWNGFSTVQNVDDFIRCINRQDYHHTVVGAHS